VLLILSDIDYVTIDYELCMLNVEINLCSFLFCNHLSRNQTVYKRNIMTTAMLFSMIRLYVSYIGV